MLSIFRPSGEDFKIHNLAGTDMKERTKKNGNCLKVLVLTTSFPLSESSYSGIFIYQLVRKLPRDVKTTVLVPGADYPVRKIKNKTFDVKCFRYAPLAWQVLAHKPGGLPEAFASHPGFILLLPFFLLSMLIHCMWMAKDNDIIHANWGINGAVAGLAGLITGTPVITTLRGTDVKRFSSSRIDRFFTRFCFLTNKKIVSVNHAITASMIRLFPNWEKKFTTIPNGISHLFYSIENSSPDPNGMVELISIGSLTEVKGHAVIIEAMSKMPKKENQRLTIIGEGPLKGKLKSRAEALGLSGQVIFKGQAAPSEIPKYLSKAHILILASFSEGRPNVVLEAMAGGLPVIASDIKGMDELIQNEKTGLLFSPGNSDELCQRIERLVKDPQFAKDIGQNAKKTILGKGLTWTAAAASYAKLYRDCI